ncbi:MAG: Holliday junction branch migration protein RuvA [Clostridia bacterium]|nr:Holliday junction branch migration protein RuvA [Clostridia bacterium]
MYYYIRGELVVSTPNMAVVDAAGVGYKMTISENTYRTLPRRTDKNPTVTLYSYLSVREDGIELFGFMNERELSSFKMLLSVSGVGPKAAMAILSLLTPEKFALAVCTEDKKTISKASGIGPKTAARIILELRDKLMKETSIDEDLSVAVLDHSAEAAGAPARGKLSEAMDALLVLGYSRAEAQNALKSIDTQALSIEDIIKEALKKLMKQ